jgi:hypothetical protein
MVPQATPDAEYIPVRGDVEIRCNYRPMSVGGLMSVISEAMRAGQRVQIVRDSLDASYLHVMYVRHGSQSQVLCAVNTADDDDNAGIESRLFRAIEDVSGEIWEKLTEDTSG